MRFSLTASIRVGLALIRSGFDPAKYRPYGDPDNRRVLAHHTVVGVHPQIRAGESLDVCTPSTETTITDLVREGAEAWNTAIRNSKFNNGFARDLFSFHTTCPTDEGSIDVRVNVVPDDRISDYCNNPDAVACALVNTWSLAAGHAPQVNGTEIHIRSQYTPAAGTIRTDFHLWVMVHELGHFLGLGDYGKCGSATFHSVMAQGRCRSFVILDDVDLVDLDDLYHPGARTDMFFRARRSDDGGCEQLDVDDGQRR